MLHPGRPRPSGRGRVPRTTRPVRGRRARVRAHRARDEVGAEVVDDVHRGAHAPGAARRRPGPPLRDVRSPGRDGSHPRHLRGRPRPRALHEAHVLRAEISKPRADPVRMSAPARDGTRARADRIARPLLRTSRAPPDGPPVQLGDVAYRLPRGVLARHQAPELLELGLHGGLIHARSRRFARRRPARGLRAEPAHRSK